jgi:hypothetical protein
MNADTFLRRWARVFLSKQRKRLSRGGWAHESIGAFPAGRRGKGVAAQAASGPIAVRGAAAGCSATSRSNAR